MPVRSTPEPEETSKQMRSCCTPQFSLTDAQPGGPPIPGLFIGFTRSPIPSFRKAAIRTHGQDSSARTASLLISSSPQGRDRSSLRHSSRSNPAGSTPRARCAGIQAASKPNRAIVIIVPPSTSGEGVRALSPLGGPAGPKKKEKEKST
jgi:hypothetical protein